MFGSLKVAVVVPAFNEEGAIAKTVVGVPGFVDHIIVVDDASTDRTVAEALRIGRRGTEVVEHVSNRGVGAAIFSGYQRALELGVDVAAVMAGDGQMYPDDLGPLLMPILFGYADYAKGNRFLSGEAWQRMPRLRLCGNLALSLLTRVSSGYADVFDSQCGYTAASRRALKVIAETGLFPRYGYPNDLLARLHTAKLTVADVPVRPIYGEGWRSGIRLYMAIYPLSYVLLSSFLRRLYSEHFRPHPTAMAEEAEKAACASVS